MTSKLFIIGSSIQTRNNPLTHSKIRTVFSAEERLRQTLFTINSITNAFPNAKIAIIDSSDKNFRKNFKYFNNVSYTQLRELSASAHEIVNTHSNKSLCESLLLNVFYKQYKNHIQQFDYVIKNTGRYFYFNMNEELFNYENKNKFFFKKPLVFEWNNSWNYQHVDLRHVTKDNYLRQYCSVLYGFGSSNLDKFIDINEAVIHLISYETLIDTHYDVETLYYYFTRPFESNIIETDWRVCGWDGASGKFRFY